MKPAKERSVPRSQNSKRHPQRRRSAASAAVVRNLPELDRYGAWIAVPRTLYTEKTLHRMLRGLTGKMAREDSLAIALVRPTEHPRD